MKELKVFNAGMAGGPAHCDSCGEDYGYVLYEGQLTLKRETIPRIYRGTTESKLLPVRCEDK
ncbi:MAG: hypothetical protein A2Y76_07565 [Planctomycetes bacterium RBG_13_60_9]|nr:MAG: hypothetical protein A2Y76_07565 [Planctomycetes bacterium RBG_13_60_9]